MAFRGSAATANASVGTSVAVTVSGIGGAGPQLNDIILMYVQGGGANGHAETVTFPTGFNPITGLSPLYDTSNGSTTAIAMKVGTASEPTSYTATYGISDFLTSQVLVFSGRNTTTPFSAVAVTTETNASASPAPFALTGLTAVAGDDVVQIVNSAYYQGNAETFAPPAGYTNGRIDYATTTFSQVASSCSLINATAGATGTNGGVLTYGVGPSVTYSAFQLSIALASAAATLFRKTLSGIGTRVGSRQAQTP